MRTLLAVLFFAAFATAAQEQPESVYGKFHRALASGDLNEMVRYAPAARRAELQAMSPAQKEASVKMMQMMLPRGFTLLNKTLAPDGKTARLVVSGPGESLPGGKPEMMYGRISMVIEQGEWKVDESSWSNDRPSAAGGAPAAKPAAAPAPAPTPASRRSDAPQPAAAPLPRTTPQTRPAEPSRPLGIAKQECVFKPVMSDEDRERCK
jgi:hypothetical protein